MSVIKKLSVFQSIKGMMALLAISSMALQSQAGSHPGFSENDRLSDGAKAKGHVVFLLSLDPLNYEADRTIPPFAEMLQKKHGYKTTILMAQGERTAARFQNLEIIKNADLVVVFARRLALSQEQLDLLKNYVKSGKPVMGIRTANHAFSLKESELKPGFHAWEEFVPDVIGCLNKGYGPVGPGIEVAHAAAAKDHVILKGLKPEKWHSNGNLYLLDNTTDKKATILLNGTSAGKTEPVAWTRLAGKSRVFYTSLGYPEDFDLPQFNQLLVNAVGWCIKGK